MYYAITIHNNSIGQMTKHERWNDAIAECKQRAESKLKRPLTKEEMEALSETGEFYDDSDADNVFTFGIGTLEN